MSAIDFERVRRTNDALRGLDALATLIGEPSRVVMSDSAGKRWADCCAERDRFYDLDLNERLVVSGLAATEGASS